MLVKKVFEFLAWKDIKSLLLVSKSWNESVKRLLQKHITLDDIHQVPKFLAKQYFEQRFHLLVNGAYQGDKINLLYVGYFPRVIHNWDRFRSVIHYIIFVDPRCFMSLVQNLPQCDVSGGFIEPNLISDELFKIKNTKFQSDCANNLRKNLSFLVDTFPKSVRQFIRSKTDGRVFESPENKHNIWTHMLWTSIDQLAKYFYDNAVGYMHHDTASSMFDTIFSNVTDTVQTQIGPQNCYDVANFVNLAVDVAHGWYEEYMTGFVVTIRIWDFFFSDKDVDGRNVLYDHLCKVDPDILAEFIYMLYENDSTTLETMILEFPYHRVDPKVGEKIISKLVINRNVDLLRDLLKSPRLTNVRTNYMKELLCRLLFPDSIYDGVIRVYQEREELLKTLMTWNKWQEEKDFLRNLSNNYQYYPLIMKNRIDVVVQQ